MPFWSPLTRCSGYFCCSSPRPILFLACGKIVAHATSFSERLQNVRATSHTALWGKSDPRWNREIVSREKYCSPFTKVFGKGSTISENRCRVNYLSAAVVFAALAGDDRRGTAALAAPRLTALLDGDARDEERRDGIGPPQAEEGVRAEPDEQGRGEVGAEHVLLAFAPRRRRTEFLAYAGLGDGERGHGHQRDSSEAYADPTGLRPRAGE